MIVGSEPTHITDVDTAKVSGLVYLLPPKDNQIYPYVMVYGQAVFDGSNLSSPSSSTKFVIQNNVYVTEYKSRDNNKAPIVLPSTSNLVDLTLDPLDTDGGWRDTSGNYIAPGSDIQIGKYDVISGISASRKYIITLVEDSSIRWIVNGSIRGNSDVISDAPYNATYTIGVTSSSGSDLPAIYKDGVQCQDTTASFKVLGDTTFTTSNNYNTSGGTKITTLSIVLIIVIIILLIVLAVLIMKYREKNRS
jgi:hypothetical protein